MATFTDQIPQFNPYIQQLPVEAMVQVGMEKQKRYDEGLQKIQTQIENIAGLDVTKPLHKQYLQSKLGELGNRLKTVAAGDFSNFQLVNSVSGMTGQIAKDPIVQNAVQSTQRIRKNEKELEIARKEGKSSPSNEYVYNLELNKWMDNPDIAATFTGTFSPYTNWRKNGLEVLKALTKDSTITEDAFTVKRDAKGNVVYGADGKPQMVIADAIVRKKLAGLTPEKVQQALLQGLTPADFRQMEIDGLYSYANVTPEKLRQNVTSDHLEDVQSYEEKKAAFKTALMSTSSEPEKEELKNKIASIDKQLKYINNDYKNLIDNIDKGNVDQVKSQLFTKNAISGFSKAFSFTEVEQEYKSSPIANLAVERQKIAIDWKKFTLKFEQDERQFAASQLMEERKLATAREANEIAKGNKYAGLSAPIPQDELPTYNLNRIVDETETSRRNLAISDDNFARANGIGGEQLEALERQYNERPNGVDAKVAQYFRTTEAERRAVKANQTMILELEREATSEFGDINQLIPKNAPNVNYRLGNQVTTFTPRDFVDFNSKKSSYITVTTTPGGKTDVNYNDKKAQEELSPKDYFLYQIEKKRLTKGSQSLTSAEQAIVDNALTYQRNVNDPYQETVKEINKYINNGLTERLAQHQGMNYNIPLGTDQEKKTFAGSLLTVLSRARSQKGGLANSPEFNDATLSKIISEPGSMLGNIRVVEGTSREPAMYEITVAGKDGISTKFKLNYKDKVDIFGNMMFEPSANVRAIRPHQEQIIKMGGVSTAYDNTMTATPTNSYLSNVDFPSVTNYGVKGNIIKVGESADGPLYIILGTVYNPVTRKWQDNVDLTGVITEENINSGLRNLNDAVIYRILNDKTPTATDLKELETLSKKPF